MSNPWPTTAKLPAGPAAVLAALHLGDSRPQSLAALRDADWRAALEFANRSQITLALRHRASEFMPPWVRAITDENAAHNGARLLVVEDLYRSISQRLGDAGIEFLALKGLTQCPLFGSQPQDRPQYDIDLYLPRETIFLARDLLQASGFESMEGMERFPTDHLPALIRKTGWQYRGDVFDPEMPLAIELHFQFWNGNLERLAAPGVEEFWARSVVRTNLLLPALAEPDALAYACLHLLKHILRGSARPFHVYEIACFLHAHASDAAFWNQWRSLHPAALRQLQAVAFRLATEWFGCATGPAHEEMKQLPQATRTWFDSFALAPALAPFDSNKDELWLHLSLLQSRADALAVASRRLFPAHLPAAVDAVYVPDADMTWRRRLTRKFRWIGYAAKRVAHHAAALPSVMRSGARWWWATTPR